MFLLFWLHVNFKQFPESYPEMHNTKTSIGKQQKKNMLTFSGLITSQVCFVN